jgi:hypothetical protein
MRRISFCALALLLGAWAAPGAFGQSTFTFGFTGPDFFAGEETTPVAGAYNCTLTHADVDPAALGAQGWSMSVAANGATITDITYYGTSAEVADSGGFASVELTTGAGNEGAVEAIVLSFKKPITYPVNGTDTMAIIQVASAIPAGGGSFTLLYKDGLQGAGEPVPNNVTQNGETRTPVLTEKVVELRLPPPSCTAKAFNLGFSGENITGQATPWAGVAGTDGTGGEIVLESALDTADLERAVFADVISQSTEFGVQGWSMSVGAMNGSAGTIAEATYSGTIAQQAETGGFASVELIDPALAENVPFGVNSGVVEAIVLSFKKPITLPLTGVESALSMVVAAAAAQGETDQVVTLKYVSGLKGSGEPVPNNFTVNGETASACNTDVADVKVVFRKSQAPVQQDFIRGNANDDGKVDIADPIYVINNLFRQGPAFACEDAADANDDGLVDSSDIAYMIAYEFAFPSAGPAPLAPFPDCGVDPTDEDGVTCLGSAACP